MLAGVWPGLAIAAVGAMLLVSGAVIAISGKRPTVRAQ
jgi:hypothetical protein